MATERRVARAYTEEFRRKAVERVDAGEKTVDVAKDLDLSASLIRGWKQKIESGKGFEERKSYDAAFKRKAVARMANETREAVAKDLGLHPSMLYDWKKKLEEGKGKSHHKKNGIPLLRKKYTQAFKDKVIAQVLKAGSQKKVGEKLGLSSGMISNWMKEKKTGQKVSKNTYIKKADRVPVALDFDKPPENAGRAMAIQTCMVMLRRIRPKIDSSDPVHLTAMLVLATLEGKL